MSDTIEPTFSWASRLRAWLELVRLPNVFTAMADVAMGFLFVRGGWHSGDQWVLGALVAASSLMYAAGVVFNDVADYEIDVRQRPERPLPSGRVSRCAARWLGGGLLLGGWAAAWLAGLWAGSFWPGLVASLLAAGVLVYDFLLKPTPLGPPAMGACRSLNVLLGMSVSPGPWGAVHGLVAVGMGTYIAGVTWFARRETQESSRLGLALSTGVIVGGVALLAWFPAWCDPPPPWLPSRWYWLMAALALLIAYRCLFAVVDPEPRRVQVAVKQCILSLVFLDAAVCVPMAGLFPAVMILLLLIPAMFLGRWVYST